MANATRVRQFTIVQFECNPRTGEHIANLEEIASNLAKYKSFTYWAYCIHDKDVYTQDAIDEMNYELQEEAKKSGLKDETVINEYVQKNAWCKIGDKKPKHIHIDVKCKSARPIEQVARFIGVPEFLVHIVKGKGAFWDCLEYLTHEDEAQQELGKHRYDDSEVFASASCGDWRKELDSRKIDEEKYGVGKTREQKQIIDVAKYGKTLNECYRELDADVYISWLVKLQKARQEYLLRLATLPNTRITIYIYGSGGSGKDVFCELLAKALYSEKSDIRDITFGIGDGKSTFDGYDGQPVITWSDIRSSDLISFVGRRAVLTVLDPHPKQQGGNVDIKFGNTKLIQEYNIINGIDHYIKFIQGVAQGYIDRNGVEHGSEQKAIEQFYRRVPIVIWVKKNSFLIGINDGVFSGNRKFCDYKLYKEISGSFAELQSLCGANKELLFELSKPMIAHVLEVVDLLKNILDVPVLSDDEITEQVKKLGYGSVLGGDVQLPLVDAVQE